MSNVSIYEKSWINLVFEGKNKEYGAYQLRQENPRTTLFAFLGGVTLITLLLCGWFLFSSFGDKPVTKIECPIEPTIVPVTLPEVKPQQPKGEKPQQPSAAKPNPFQNYIVAATPLVNTEVPITRNIEPQTGSTGPDTGTGPAIDTPSEGGTPTGTVIAAPAAPEGPVSTTVLDRLPAYPGGIEKFYQYIIYNIDKPEVDDHLSSISVLMSFVIEKDGSMTDIKALRSTDKNLEREAIKVLKTLKVKWSPGYKDNQKMRTLYVLPIKVTL